MSQENKNSPEEGSNKDALFGFLILTTFILFWIVFNFLASIILTLIGAVIFQKFREDKEDIEEMIPTAIGAVIVLIILATFIPAIQSDREFREERDEIVSGEAQDFNYLTEESSDSRDVELQVMDIIGYETNREDQKIREIEVDDGFVYLGFVGNSNLSTDMAKRGMLSDVRDLLEKLPQRHSYINEIEVEVWFPLVDEYGNTEMSSVMEVSATEDNWQEVNWDNFLTENLPNIVNDFWTHSAMQE